MTEPGKLFVVQSNNGSVKWSFYSPDEKIVKVFVEQKAGIDQHLSLILITDKSEIHLNPLTGSIYSKHPHQFDISNHLFMLLKGDSEAYSVTRDYVLDYEKKEKENALRLSSQVERHISTLKKV